MSEEHCKVVKKATEQLQYDVLCLGDEEIFALGRIIRAYVKSEDKSDKLLKILELTDEEVTMLFYMAGYSCNECSKSYPEEYSSLMTKLNELVSGVK